MAKKINVALLGSKFMGKTHSHAYRNVKQHFDLPLEPVMHTVADLPHSEAEVKQFAEKWGWQNASTDWEAAAKADDIGLVDIVTPNFVHRKQAEVALEAGKHVLCEKPLADTLDNGRAMAEAAKKHKKCKTFVGFTYRKCPAVSFARKLVRDGRLGRIYHVRANYLQDWGGPETPLIWRFKGETAGSGAHGDLGAHMIDMTRFVTGEEFTEISGAIEHTFVKQREKVDEEGNLTGEMGESTVDDTVLFLGRLEGGAVTSVESTRLSIGDKNRNRIEIHGEKGAIRFDFERMNELEWYDATLEAGMQGWSTISVTEPDGSQPFADHWWVPGHVIGYDHAFVNQAADVINIIAGKDPISPVADFEDAYQTQRVLEAAIQSARNRGPVPMEQIT